MNEFGGSSRISIWKLSPSRSRKTSPMSSPRDPARRSVWMPSPPNGSGNVWTAEVGVVASASSSTAIAGPLDSARHRVGLGPCSSLDPSLWTVLGLPQDTIVPRGGNPSSPTLTRVQRARTVRAHPEPIAPCPDRHQAHGGSRPCGPRESCSLASCSVALAACGGGRGQLHGQSTGGEPSTAATASEPAASTAETPDDGGQGATDAESLLNELVPPNSTQLHPDRGWRRHRWSTTSRPTQSAT